MTQVNPLRRLRVVPAATAADASASDAGPDDGATDALRRAARGDEGAFAAFYDLTAGLVHGIVLRIVRSPALAEEVTQEVYVELWRVAPRFDSSRGSARTFCATVAHRRAVDRVRSEQSRRDRELADAHRNATIEVDETGDELDQELDRARVRHALSQLSERQREAVTLAYYGGLTYVEVATLLDVAEGTVKTRIRDAMIKLRGHLGEEP